MNISRSANFNLRLPLLKALLLLAAVPASHGSTLYSTDFSAPTFTQGVDTWAGVDGWKTTTATGGVQGITATTDGNQVGYLGFNAPTSATTFIWRDFDYDPVSAGTPVMEIKLNLAVIDSTNGNYDAFFVQIYNSSTENLASLSFDNSNFGIYRNDGTSSPRVYTGFSFGNGSFYSLSLQIDFAANTWSAQLGGISLFQSAVFNGSGKSRDLGEVDFLWSTDVATPGNNYLAVDDFSVSALEGFTWDGGGSNDLWSTGANWSNNLPPLNDGTADVHFAGSTRLTPNTAAAYNVHSITFDSGAGSFALSGSTLTLGTGGITQNSANAQTINNPLVLGALQTWTLARSAGTLTLGSTAVINNNGKLLIVDGASGTTATFNGAISGAGGFTTSGAGTVMLGADNLYTGTTTVSGGTLKVTGSLNGTTGTALTFGNTGTFNAAEAAGRAQGMGALTFSRGDGTVQSTYGGSGNTSLTFSSLAARAAGATGNFVVTNGTNGTTNQIKLTGQAAGFIDQGTFFGGNNYAWMNAAGTYVRGINYGSGGDSATASGVAGTSYDGTYNHVKSNGAISAQATKTWLTLNLAGNFNFTLAAGATLTVNGLLKGGNVAGGAILSGGTGIRAGNDAEMVIRTDGINDALTISTPILANGTNALTKSGAGILTLSAANNAYTGRTTINNGTLLVSGTHTVISGSAGGYLVQSTGTLGGNGIINLSAVNLGVTIASGGHLSPGLSAGTFTLALGTGVLDLSGAVGGSNTGALQFELAGLLVSDKILFTSGTLNIGTGLLDFGDFAFTDLSGFGDAPTRYSTLPPRSMVVWAAVQAERSVEKLQLSASLITIRMSC